MTKDLQEIKLDFEKTYHYVVENLDNTNTLASNILKYLDFRSGFFYTLMPSNSNQENLYDFYAGGKTKVISNEICMLIYENLKANPELICVFDNESESYEEGYREELFSTNGFHYKNEIFYTVNSSEVTPQLISRCLYVSNAIWHSLCILTNYKLKFENQDVSFFQLKEVCFQIDMLIIGAYDAEGYIFWKKRQDDAPWLQIYH